MQKEYETPKTKIIWLDTCDAITTSEALISDTQGDNVWGGFGS